jgi:multimeric flavodoxin WrbA
LFWRQAVKILAISSSPRKGGNSDLLLDAAIKAAANGGADVEKLHICELSIKPCTGCLRCNLTGRCAQKGDDWAGFSAKFVEADALLIAAPVYFWYVPGTLKTLIDRFRSLIHVTMGTEHITCTPRDWKPKNFGFILVQGEPTGDDLAPAIEMLRMFAQRMGRGGRIVGEVLARGPALKGQVAMRPERLAGLFQKVGLPSDAEFVESQQTRYRKYFDEARRLGSKIADQ